MAKEDDDQKAGGPDPVRLPSGDIVQPRPDGPTPKQAHPASQATRAELNHLIHLAGLVQAELPHAAELPGGMVSTLARLAYDLRTWNQRLEGALSYLADPPPGVV